MPTMSSPVDWRLLLKKYISGVGAAEGVTFWPLGTTPEEDAAFAEVCAEEDAEADARTKELRRKDS